MAVDAVRWATGLTVTAYQAVFLAEAVMFLASDTAGYVNGQVVIASAHNVASVVRTAAGRYRVRFAVAMPDANYCWTALARSSTNSGMQRVAIVRASSDLKTAQYVDISCATTATSFDDSSEINLVVYR